MTDLHALINVVVETRDLKTQVDSCLEAIHVGIFHCKRIYTVQLWCELLLCLPLDQKKPALVDDDVEVGFEIQELIASDFRQPLTRATMLVRDCVRLFDNFAVDGQNEGEQSEVTRTAEWCALSYC